MLLTPLGGGEYGVHPALPAYLAARWRAEAGPGFEGERAAARRALLSAYALFGVWLLQQLQSGAAETALALLERQRRTMGQLLALALGDGLHAEAQAILQPLDAYWNARGLAEEANGWADRVRQAIGGPAARPRTLPAPPARCGCSPSAAPPTGRSAPATGPAPGRRTTPSATRWRPPRRASYATAGWPSPTTTSAWWCSTAAISPPPRRGTRNRWRSSRRWATGRAWRKATTSSAGWRRTAAISPPPRRGTRNRWKSLRRSATGQAWRAATASLDCWRKPAATSPRRWIGWCAASLFAEFPHPSTGPGPRHLARLTQTLGLPALEQSWQRCTGRPLPAAVRSGVERMMREGGSH